MKVCDNCNASPCICDILEPVPRVRRCIGYEYAPGQRTRHCGRFYRPMDHSAVHTMCGVCAAADYRQRIVPRLNAFHADPANGFVPGLMKEIALVSDREHHALSPDLRRIARGTRRGLEHQLADARLGEWKMFLSTNSLRKI